MFTCFVKVLEILCAHVLGCAALLPERRHLHMLAVHILLSLVRSNKNSCKQLATTQ
jgi:hypothetical protein